MRPVRPKERAVQIESYQDLLTLRLPDNLRPAELLESSSAKRKRRKRLRDWYGHLHYRLAALATMNLGRGDRWHVDYYDGRGTLESDPVGQASRWHWYAMTFQVGDVPKIIPGRGYRYFPELVIVLPLQDMDTWPNVHFGMVCPWSSGRVKDHYNRHDMRLEFQCDHIGNFPLWVERTMMERRQCER